MEPGEPGVGVAVVPGPVLEELRLSGDPATTQPRLTVVHTALEIPLNSDSATPRLAMVKTSLD